MLRYPLEHDVAEYTMCLRTCAKVLAPLHQNLAPPRLAPRSPRVSTPAPALVASKLLSEMASRSTRSLPSVVPLVDTPMA
ncbi:hypothetical protein GN958_ATG03782 [Phytophthora infestans]|uniref:Uncharacterized protein n=1 Tax=Phytophthora infestans TaxID=4787 RepID=A0A8S9V0R2_PHYIN|nr:hypothetical protein GN958_ATG03782 [Phytophthora infestans]